MDKETVVVHLLWGILLSHEKEWNSTIATKWPQLEAIILSELSQSQKDKYHMSFFILYVYLT